MSKANLLLVTREGVNIFEIANQFKVHENMPTKAEAKRLEKELSEEHLEYNGVALTENYIIKVSCGNSPREYIVKPDNTVLRNNAFAWIRYDEVLWVYTEESNGHPLDILDNIAKGAIQITLTGVPRIVPDGRAILAIYPKNEDKAIIVCDTKKFFSSTIRQLRGKIKVSDEFDRFRSEILNRLPNDYYAGDTPENRAAYYDAIGKELPNNQPNWYQEDDDDEDDML